MSTTVHQSDLSARYIGDRIQGTTGSTGVDFEGVLQAVRHEIDDLVGALVDVGNPDRVRTRTTVTVGGQEFLLARGSSVVIP